MREAGQKEKRRNKKRKVKRRIKESAGKPAAIDMSTYINRRRTQTVPKGYMHRSEERLS